MHTLFDNKQSLRQRAHEFIKWLDETGKKDFVRTEAEINEQFASVFDYCVNGQTKATNAKTLLERFNEGHGKFLEAFIHFPVPIEIDNDVVEAKYKATFIFKNGVEFETENHIKVLFDENNKVYDFKQNFNPPVPQANPDIQLCNSLAI